MRQVSPPSVVRALWSAPPKSARLGSVECTMAIWSYQPWVLKSCAGYIVLGVGFSYRTFFAVARRAVQVAPPSADLK
jgi:hypothetical protein